jgi:hypothetical protein
VWSPLRRFFNRTRVERALVFRAAGWLAAAQLALWVFPYRRVEAAGKRWPRRTARTSAASPGQIAWAIEAAGRRMPGASCLAKALAARVLLERAGYLAEIRFGVVKNDAQGLEAHAWVESEGQRLIGAEPSRRFAPLVLPETPKP